MFREIPIIDASSQQLTTTLSGQRVDMRISYSTWANRWAFDLDVEGMRVLSGRKIVLGVDLLQPFGLGIGSLIAAPWGNDEVEPGRTELPSGRVRLFHYDPAEAAA